MKISTLGLGIAAIAVSVMASSTAQAATLSFASGPTSLTSDVFEFEFIPPTKGDFKSTLFVADSAKNSVQTLFTELGFGEPNGVTPNGSVYSGAWAATSGTYTLGWSSVEAPATLFPTVYSDMSTPVQFRLDGADSGWYTFSIEDKITSGAVVSDFDYNDGKFRVRAVPVPAIVPGIALAAAFFGSKALKRNKKTAAETVA